MDQERPPPAPPPPSSQTVKKRRNTVNEELSELAKMHCPNLSYKQIASPDFDMDLLNQEDVPEDVQNKIKDKRRQVCNTKY